MLTEKKNFLFNLKNKYGAGLSEKSFESHMLK